MITTTKFTSTPPDDSALKLRVTQSADQRTHGQFCIENGEGFLGGEWDRYYVNLSGYCGEHNPSVFAAAPELYAELTEARTTLSILRTQVMVEIGRCPDPSESCWEGVPEKLKERIDAIDAALAKSGSPA